MLQRVLCGGLFAQQNLCAGNSDADVDSLTVPFGCSDLFEIHASFDCHTISNQFSMVQLLSK